MAEAPKTEITICDTCKFPSGETTRDGRSAGETFFTELQLAVEALDTDQKAKLRLRPFSCLMNCARACSAAVSAADGANKVSYVLGDFEPDREAAEALVGYALGHAASDTGVVPFKTWPQGVKGHFIARVPARREPEE